MENNIITASTAVYTDTTISTLNTTVNTAIAALTGGNICTGITLDVKTKRSAPEFVVTLLVSASTGAERAISSVKLFEEYATGTALNTAVAAYIAANVPTAPANYGPLQVLPYRFRDTYKFCGLLPLQTKMGARYMKVAALTTSTANITYALLPTDEILKCTASTASWTITINLPTAATSAGRTLLVTQLAGTNATTVAANGSEKIYETAAAGAASVAINEPGERIFLWCDGTNWYSSTTEVS